MYSVTNSFGLNGLRGFAVAVEADVSGGLPAFSIVGLPDSAVRESADRVRAAIKNLGFRFPDRRITINLAPADVRKTGPVYDLPLLLALLTAIALTIFMLEAQIPSPVPIPGVKLGLANIVTVFTVFVLGPKEGAAVLAVRVFLGAVFAGNFSTILYSAAGGVCAIGVTIALRKILTKKQLWVAGCLGAVAHSVGQMAMAIALTGTVSLAVYLPVMIVISILTGLFTGLCAQFLVNREKLWKIISK